MDFEPKIIPEGINTSKEHPLRELLVLVSALTVIVVVITALLTAGAGYLVRFIPIEKENEWFSSAFLAEQALAGKVLQEPLAVEVNDYLDQLVEQLRDVERPGYRFTVNLVDGGPPNAFVVPGGHIFVTAGLLTTVQSENGLAMVLAHEMAHQYHRHPLRGLGRGIVISLALIAISGVEGGGLAEKFVGNTAILTGLGFSREQERDADRLGVDLLTRRYGHSAGADEFFTAMLKRADEAIETPIFLSTHPGLDERIGGLRPDIRYSAQDLTPLPPLGARYLESRRREH